MFDYNGNLILSHDDIKASLMDAYAEKAKLYSDLEDFSIRDTSCPSRPDDFFNKGTGYSRFVSACWRLDFQVAGLDYVFYIYCRNKTNKKDGSITIPSSLLVGKETDKKLVELSNPHYADCLDFNFVDVFFMDGEVNNVLDKLKSFANTYILEPILKDMGVM